MYVYFLMTYFPVLVVVIIHKNMVYALICLYFKQWTQLCHPLFTMACVQLLFTCENTCSISTQPFKHHYHHQFLPLPLGHRASMKCSQWFLLMASVFISLHAFSTFEASAFILLFRAGFKHRLHRRAPRGPHHNKKILTIAKIMFIKRILTK